MSTDEIQQVVRKQVLTVRGAVEELKRSLLETALTEEYRKATGPLNDEAAKLTA